MQPSSLSTVVALRLGQDTLTDPLRLYRSLRRACDLIEFDPETEIDSLSSAEPIPIKIDLTPPVSHCYEQVDNTPYLCAGVAEWLAGHGRTCLFVDSPARLTGKPVRAPLESCRSRQGIPASNIEWEGPIEVLIDSRLYLMPQSLSRPSRVVNLARVDFDGWGWYAGAIAGLAGCLPGLTMHPSYWFAADPGIIASSLVDLLTIIRPALTILEVPLQPEHECLILIGRDPVAMDATIADCLGLSGAEIPAVRLAAEAGLGLGWPEAVPLVGDIFDPTEVRQALDSVRPARAMFDGVLSGLLHPLSGPFLGYDAMRCVGCGECVKNCPNNALEIKPGRCLRRNSRECRRCWRCRSACRHGAHRPQLSRPGRWLDRRRRRTCVA